LGVNREVKRAQAAATEHGEHPSELSEDFGVLDWENLEREAAANFLHVHRHASAIGARGHRVMGERVPAGLSKAN
jgi:hypothetical protein